VVVLEDDREIPPSGLRRVDITLSSVLFPEPDLPRTQTKSPSPMERDTSFSTLFSTPSE
jgi:hypothetical protein